MSQSKLDRNYQPYADGLGRLVAISPGQHFIRHVTVKAIQTVNESLTLADLHDVVPRQGMKYLQGLLGGELISIKGSLFFDTNVYEPESLEVVSDG